MIRRLPVVVATSGLLVIHLVHAQQPPATTSDRYRLLATRSTGTLQKELGAIGESYRVLSTWNDQSQKAILLERAEGEAGRDFRIVAAVSLGTLNKEVAAAAADGFRLAPGGILRNPDVLSTGGDRLGEEVVLLLERPRGDPQRYEYLLSAPRVTYTWTESTESYVGALNPLLVELEQRAAEGYQLVGYAGRSAGVSRRQGPCLVHNVLVWERSAPAPSVAYRVIEGRSGPGLHGDLDKAVAEGFQVRLSARIDLPDEDHLSVIMEKAGAQEAGDHYLSLGAFDLEGLDNQLRLAGERGYRIHPLAAHVDPPMVIMRRSPDERRRFRYRVVETLRMPAFEGDLLSAAREGVVTLAGAGSRQLYELGSGQGGLGALLGSRPSYTITLNSPTPVALVEIVEGAPTSEPSGPAGATPAWTTVRLPIQASPVDMQRDLNAAAKDGSRLWLIGVSAGGGIVHALFEKPGDRVAPFEYQVLTTSRDSSLQNELNAIAKQGFRFVPGALFIKPTRASGAELTAVVERAPGGEAARQYLVLSTRREDTLQAELAKATADGYRALGRTYRGDHVVVLERPAP